MAGPIQNNWWIIKKGLGQSCNNYFPGKVECRQRDVCDVTLMLDRSGDKLFLGLGKLFNAKGIPVLKMQ